MQLRDVLCHAKTVLKDCGVISYALDAELLLAHVLKKDREYIICHDSIELESSDFQAYIKLIEKRQKRRPLAQIIGQREFYGLVFKVTGDTLDPRPDSETLIESALQLPFQRDDSLTILDIGTGSGCLLLTLLALFPHAFGIGTDVNYAAIKVAKENAAKLKLANRADFIVSNWSAGLGRRYDIVVSNPPYIKSGVLGLLEPEVKYYEPRIALEGGEDGLKCYRALAPYIKNSLAENGFALLEFGQEQHNNVKKILKKANLRFVSFSNDLAGITRCITVKH